MKYQGREEMEKRGEISFNLIIKFRRGRKPQSEEGGVLG